MRNVFVNRYSEVRSGWKIAIVFVFYFLLSLLAGMIVAPFFSGGVIGESGVYGIFTFIAQLVPILAVLLVLKLVDKKGINYIGIRDSKNGINDFGFGFLLGAVFMTVIFVVLLMAGKISLENSLTNPVFSSYLLSGLVLYILVGFSEELLFRGYVMTALLQTGNIKLAVLISAVLFAIAHGANPNVTLIGLTNIFAVGTLFAFMFLKTGNLWMPIGFHISWNFFQGNIFGFPVSGTQPHGIYNIADVEGMLLSGGAFGPEGGALATVLLILGFVFVWKYPTRQRQKANVNQS